MSQSSIVSIHAPAWGATIKASDARLQRPVSIHAPAWGATGGSINIWLLLMFQSTHPRGVRHPNYYFLYTYIKFQSTHPRGVRRGLPNGFGGNLPCVSIHAPAWGATLLTLRVMVMGTVFQSTHPRGVRHGHQAAQAVLGDVSIHAPAWGATRPQRPAGDRGGVSIHAPAWGAT